MFRLYEKEQENLKKKKKIRLLLVSNFIFAVGLLIVISFRENIITNTINNIINISRFRDLLIICSCLSFIAYLGCVIYYMSTKKQIYFILSLLYLNLSVSMMLNEFYHKDSVDIFNTIFRMIILIMVVKDKSLIKSKPLSIFAALGFTLINFILDYILLTHLPIHKYIYIVPVILFIISICYFICTILLAIKTLKEVDIIYSYVIGSIYLLIVRGFCRIFQIFDTGKLNSEYSSHIFILLTIISFTYIIIGAFIQLIANSNESDFLEQELTVFFHIAEFNCNDNIILFDNYGNVCYANKILRELLCKSNDIINQYKELIEIIKENKYRFEDLYEELKHEDYIKKSKVIEELGIVVDLQIQKIITRTNKKYYMIKFNDITQDYNKNKSIRESENVLTDILNSITDSIVAIDDQGIIMHMNKAAIDAIGQLDFKGKNINYYDLINDSHNRNLVLNAVNEKVIYTITGANGEIKLESFISKTNNFNLRKVGKMIISRDLGRKENYDNLLLEYDNFKEYEKRKSNFFINLSHEFKTPINVIFSAMQLLEVADSNNEKELVNTYNKYKKSIKLNCLRMSRIVTNMIDILRFETEDMEMQFSNVNIVELIEEVVSYIAKYSINKNINIIFDTEFEEMIISCDTNKIVRVITNLLANAIKFSKENSDVYVNIKREEALVEYGENLSEKKDSLIIEIKDTGIGISSDMCEAIFKPFSQIDTSLNRRNEGCGMGLSISKKLVKLHGGNILIESKVGQGSKFSIVMPISNLTVFNDESVEQYSIDFKEIDTEISDIYELY